VGHDSAALITGYLASLGNKTNLESSIKNLRFIRLIRMMKQTLVGSSISVTTVDNRQAIDAIYSETASSNTL